MDTLNFYSNLSKMLKTFSTLQDISKITNLPNFTIPIESINKISTSFPSEATSSIAAAKILKSITTISPYDLTGFKKSMDELTSVSKTLVDGITTISSYDLTGFKKSIDELTSVSKILADGINIMPESVELSKQAAKLLASLTKSVSLIPLEDLNPVKQDSFICNDFISGNCIQNADSSKQSPPKSSFISPSDNQPTVIEPIEQPVSNNTESSQSQKLTLKEFVLQYLPIILSFVMIFQNELHRYQDNLLHQRERYEDKIYYEQVTQSLKNIENLRQDISADTQTIEELEQKISICSQTLENIDQYFIKIIELYDSEATSNCEKSPEADITFQSKEEGTSDTFPSASPFFDSKSGIALDSESE